MKRTAGKVHWMILVGGVGMFFILGLLLFSGESPTGVAVRFMGALADGDYKELAELSHIEGRDQKDLEEDWKFATEVAGKYYSFRYRFVNQVDSDKNTASVRTQVWRNYNGGSSYEENFPLPITKVDGKWKVLVRGLSRKMYPGLPR
jgi:hypothetical protein